MVLQLPNDEANYTNNGSTPDRYMLSMDISGKRDEDSFTHNLFPFAEGVEFTVTMSDSSGDFGTGGTSKVIKVSEGNGNYCFQNSKLTYKFDIVPWIGWKECDNVSISTIDKTNDDPYDYYAITPDSTPIHMAHMTENDDIAWYTFTQPKDTNVAVVSLAQGSTSRTYNTGGSSTLRTIGEGSDSSCVRAIKPSPTDTKGTSSINKGKLAGIIVGVIVGFLLIMAGLIFFIIKYKRNKNRENARRVGDVDANLGNRITPYFFTQVSSFNTNLKQSLLQSKSENNYIYHSDGGPIANNENNQNK